MNNVKHENMKGSCLRSHHKRNVCFSRTLKYDGSNNYINYCCEVFEKLFLRSVFSLKFRFCFVKFVKVDFSRYRCFPVLIFCFHLYLNVSFS